jgi:RNA polymerase sigma-70 factor (ECF subfamily)
MNQVPPSTTINVQNWLDRYRAGDETARNELARHAQRRLEVMIHRMHHRKFANVKVDTSDVRQDVMMRMHGALQNVLLGTARDYFNLAAFHIRLVLLEYARRQRPHLQLEPAPALEDPKILAIWAEIHRWIEALPEEERELWHLLWYNALTQEEAAKILGISRAGLRRRWQATRIRFVERFGKDPFGK